MGLTREELAAWVARSRREQGLPVKVVDPVTVCRLAEALTVGVSVTAGRLAS